MAQGQKTEKPAISKRRCQWQREWYHSNRSSVTHHPGP